MANKMFTQLPTTSAAELTDIIAAVQGFVSALDPGESVQETLQQVFDLFQENLIIAYAGNPNGLVPGTVYKLLWDSTDKILYVCTTSGNAATTVWTPCIGQLTNGQLRIGSTGNTPVAATLTGTSPITITNGAGTITISTDQIINSGTADQIAYYAATGNDLSGTSTIPAAVQANITAVGTIASGVWNGTDIAVSAGGTGVSSLTPYAVICGGTTSTSQVQSIASVGSAGQALISNGPGALPTFQVLSNSAVPIGTIIDYAGTSAPTDYLVCDGTSYDTTTYATLFAAIGYTWGGSGANFNVPDLQRRTTIGSGGSGTATIGNAVGNTGGEETHLQANNEVGPHVHAPLSGGNYRMAGSGVDFGSTGSAMSNAATTGDVQYTAGSQTAFNVIQPSAVVLKCIRYQ